MGLTLVTPPATEPVSLDEAKAQCRVTRTDEDTYLTGLIKAATRHVERQLDLSLMARTYRLTLDAFSDTIELERGPASEITAVTYFDADGGEQTLDAEYYTGDLSSRRQWLVLNQGYSWPTVLDGINAVSVEYVAGFDELPNDYLDLKHAILIGIQKLYERSADPRSDDAMDKTFEALLQPYRLVMV